MKWVTWEDVGVDRMACAWLIRRFIDPQAEFQFIAVGASWPAEAEPFDIPGVRLSHHQGHCTFHALLHHYELHDPILKRMAAIIDEADIVQEIALEPIAAGLEFLCRGLRRISATDHSALERSYLLYEGFYAQLTEETR